MADYFYVGGSESKCGNVALKNFGQQIDLTPEQAEEAQRGGCVLLDADDFNAIGFTPDELKKYPTAGYQLNAPQSFKDKRQAAWTKFGEIYAKLHNLNEQPKPAALPETPMPPTPEQQAPIQPPPVIVEQADEEHHEG